MTYIDGLATGLNTTDIIRQLMQIERMPQTRLMARRATTERVVSALGDIRSDVNQLRTMAADLRLPSAWQGLKATSSSDAVSVAARSGQVTGSLDLRVAQTAAARSIYANEAVASLGSVVVPGGGALLAAGEIGVLGFAGLTGTGVPAGDLPLTVTRSSAAAAITAGSAPATPLTVTTGTNDQLAVRVDGVAHTLTLAAGTYNTADQLATALGAAITAAGLGGQLAATVDGGRIRLATVHEGSSHHLEVRNSTARQALGFGPNGSALTAAGTDGVVTFNGDTVTIPSTKPPAQVVVGNLTMTIGGPIRAGEVVVKTVDIGGGTLGEVIQAINAAHGLGFSAAAVNVGNGYRLQLTAKQTGAHSSVAVDTSRFSYSGFTTLTEGRDARVVVDGINPYTITSASNTLTDLLPGVDVTLRRATADTVRVDVQKNHEATADRVGALVSHLNAVLAKLDSASKASPDAAQRGLLVGSSELRRARQELVSALTREVGGVLDAVGNIGIAMQRDGTIGFDRDRFVAADRADSRAIQNLFVGAVGDLGDGVVDRLVNAATAASSATSGYLKVAEDGARARIEDFTRQIEDLERRYAAKELYYRRMFSSLETMLGSLQSQSNWLAGQLGSLTAQQDRA
jgi:flagellar hook-associated protein 2